MDEISWLLSHPGFDLSDQMVRLLKYLARKSDAGNNCGVSQYDIAVDVLSHPTDFDPSSDAHARIKVHRLRVALSSFYEMNRPNRPVRVAIPKGRYRVDLVPASRQPEGLPNPQQAAPKLAICVMHAQTSESGSVAFEFETGVLQRLAQSPLVQDGALAAITVPGQSISAALDAAFSTDSATLVVFRVCVTGGTANIALLLFDPKDRRLLAEKLLFDGSVRLPGGCNMTQLAQQAAMALADPILGIVPLRMARLFPRSRLAALMTFFKFMQTQDRALLPGSLTALTDFAATPNATALSEALLVDAIRASYCFATSNLEQFSSHHCDRALRAVEQAPENCYTLMAYGYAALSSRSSTCIDDTLTSLNNMSLSGAQKSDASLLHILTGKESAEAVAAPPDGTFLDDTWRFLRALKGNDATVASDTILLSNHKDNFWISVFQTVAAAEVGELVLARSKYARLRCADPAIDDYLGRAIVTMIPDPEIHERILRGTTLVA